MALFGTDWTTFKYTPCLERIGLRSNTLPLEVLKYMESEEQLYAAYSPIPSNNTILDDSTMVTNISELLTNSQAIITDNLEKMH